jgi:pyruvate carboxylase
VLKSARAEAIDGRPGAAMPPADFAAASLEIEARTKLPANERDVLSYLLYPQVFLEYRQHWIQFGDTATLPTANFFYGLQPAEEMSVEIERGKTLIVKYLTTGEVREDGTRTVFFELNGQPRDVIVTDRSVAATATRHPKAEPDNANHIAAPMPGKVSSMAVKPGQAVKSGDRLLSIEAMKMETAVYSPREATVAAIHVQAGAVVEARDLLVVLGD